MTGRPQRQKGKKIDYACLHSVRKLQSEDGEMREGTDHGKEVNEEGEIRDEISDEMTEELGAVGAHQTGNVPLTFPEGYNQVSR